MNCDFIIASLFSLERLPIAFLSQLSLFPEDSSIAFMVAEWLVSTQGCQAFSPLKQIALMLKRITKHSTFRLPGSPHIIDFKELKEGRRREMEGAK